jgi:hypothetical protein
MGVGLPLSDKGSHTDTVSADTCASTKAGVGPAFVRDVLFAIAESLDPRTGHGRRDLLLTAQTRCMGCVAEMPVLAWKRVSAPTRSSCRRSERSLLLSQKRAVGCDRCS